jgi:hypothetical protein
MFNAGNIRSFRTREMTGRRFPPPSTVIEYAASFWVQDAGGADRGVGFPPPQRRDGPPILLARQGREAAGCHGFHPPEYGFHLAGVTASGVPLLELTQPDAVRLHGLGSL